MNPISNAGVFLVSTLFGLYILAVMLRLILQLVRADFYNGLSQFIVKVTNPPLKALRRIIPGFAGIDMSSIVFMLILQMLELLIIGLLRDFPLPNILGLTIYAAAELLTLSFYIFLFSILILVVLSWVNPGHYNPVTNLLHQIADPVMRPVRRLLPAISGMDLSPMFAMVGLWLVKLLLLDPLAYWAHGVAYPTARVLFN